MRQKRAKEIKRRVKHAAFVRGVVATPNMIRNAKKDYANFGSRNSQRPKLKLSKRQQRIQAK